MSHIPDLQRQPDGSLAVGWLHPGHPFPTGDADRAFARKLRKIARVSHKSVDALNWALAFGSHTCEFCGKDDASGTFGIPAGDVLFYAPEMIAHYVERHGYLPPQPFVDAVLACPLPGTPEYAALAAPFAGPLG